MALGHDRFGYFWGRNGSLRHLTAALVAACIGTTAVAENLCESGDLVESKIGGDTFKHFAGFDGLALKIGSGCVAGSICEIAIMRKYKGRYQQFLDLSINGDPCTAFEKHEKTSKNPSYKNVQNYPLHSFPNLSVTEYSILLGQERLNFVIDRYHHGRKLPQPSMYDGSKSAGLVHKVDVTMGSLYISSK